MPARLKSEACDLGDGRIATVSCWMPPSDSEGMLFIRVGSVASLYPGVVRVTRTGTHVRLLFASGMRWELRRIRASRL